MVNSCSAVGCKNKNTKGTNITFHRFPLNNQHLLKLWLYQIKRGNWEPSKYSVLCSEHFTEDSFVIKGVHNRRTLKNDACPTKFSIASYTESIKKKKVIKEKAEDVDMAETSDDGKQGEEQQDSTASKSPEEEEEEST